MKKSAISLLILAVPFVLITVVFQPMHENGVEWARTAQYLSGVLALGIIGWFIYATVKE